MIAVDVFCCDREENAMSRNFFIDRENMPNQSTANVAACGKNKAGFTKWDQYKQDEPIEEKEIWQTQYTQMS